jgi:creatinine amidohydrolase
MSDHELTQGGYSIFHETMADMTYPEVERAAREGAVALWSLAVIEEHGPHLPLGTDVYLPYVRLRQVRRLLLDRGVKSVIVPAYFWGVNHVTGGFPGSINIRPGVMVELMTDVFRSLFKDGFRTVFCHSGHGDALHNRTIDAAVQLARADIGLDACIVLDAGLARRLGHELPQPHLVVTPTDPPVGDTFMDVHAGDWETSVLWGFYPGLVKDEISRTLPATNFAPEDLAEWRKGGEHTQRKTPAGYLGNPAAADPQRGRQIMERDTVLIADAIAAHVTRAGR